MWATWAFRIVLILTTAATMVIPAFSVAATDHTILTRSFSTGTGTSITLPDPAAHAGRILTFIENTASSWTTNYSIITTTGSPLTVISGTMTIQAIDGDWWLVSKM